MKKILFCMGLLICLNCSMVYCQQSDIIKSDQNFDKYPVQDFYNRSIELPIDYNNPQEGTFFLYYQLTSNFDFNRPTIFFFYDTQQQYGLPGKVDELAKNYGFYDLFNVVRYQMRGRKYSFINVKSADSTVNWEKAYGVFSSKQVIEDIEKVRLDLFSEQPDAKIYIFGRSGGGYLVEEYLVKYSDHVKRAFIESACNPLIMKDLGYIESKYLFNTLNNIDTSLYIKLKDIITKNTVPTVELLWILKGIPYKSKNPNAELAQLLNELYENKTNLFNVYITKKGFDIKKLMIPEKEMDAWEIGGVLRPLECSGYIFEPEQTYIDPLYDCLRVLCNPYLKLIDQKIVQPPVYPSLEEYKKINTEVFYLNGKKDHVSPYQIVIELGKYIKAYDYYIADDNHNLTIYKDCYPKLRVEFFSYGLGSTQLQAARRSGICNEFVP